MIALSCDGASSRRMSHVWLMVSVSCPCLCAISGFSPLHGSSHPLNTGFLYMTMLGAPWLVRERGHVHIELVTAALPPRCGALSAVSWRLACVAVSLIAGMVRALICSTNIERNDYDVRAYFYPRWMLTHHVSGLLQPDGHRVRPLSSSGVICCTPARPASMIHE
jgi:hypothetical protein